MKVQVVVLGLVWLTLGLPAPGLGQTDSGQNDSEEQAESNADYEAAVSEAVAHYTAQRFRPALDAFERAHALQPSARTFRGLGLCAFYLGDHAAAHGAIERALSDTRRPLPAEQRAELQKLLEAAARESGRFELRVTPHDARVELAGAEVAGRVLYLPRGEHVLELSAPGHAREQLTLRVLGGEARVLQLALAPRAELTRPPLAPVPISAPDAPKPSARDPDGARAEPNVPDPIRMSEAVGTPSKPEHSRLFTYLAAAAVPAFGATAGAIWLRGKSKRDAIDQACQREGCDQAEADRRTEAAHLDRYELWTHVALGATGLAAGAAIVAFILETPDPSPELSVEAARGGVQLRIRY